MRCLVSVALLLPQVLPAQGPFELDVMSTGQGQVYPYRIRKVDALGNPTSVVLDIRSRATLVLNLNARNGVLPVATWPTTAVLPNGAPGNQFLLARFTDDLDLQSVLSGLPASQPSSYLTGALSVLVRDPGTGATAMARGQAFVGGWTYYDDPNTPVLDPKLVQAVGRSGSSVAILDPRANGFPRGFAGDLDLVDPRSFVFVPDADQNLSTFETFPTGRLLRLTASSAVRNARGAPLALEVCTATTVGTDPDPAGVLSVAPLNGQTNVDPRTSIDVGFDKPVQPLDLGPLFSNQASPGPGGVRLDVIAGVIALPAFPVMTFAEPRTIGDLCAYRILPASALPGSTQASVRTVPPAIHSLSGNPGGTPWTSSFTTGPGPGFVNVPVAPEAVYIGLAGAAPGVSVIDLNGFGQGTGSPGMTSFSRNPNIGRPGVYPVLWPGTSTIDAGGAGALTLGTDHLGDPRVLREPLCGSITDIQLGQPLDLRFNNENINPYASSANQVNPATMTVMPGNTIAVAPHPNPPRLSFPSPNAFVGIWTEEPTVTSSQGPSGRVLTTSPPCMQSPINLLVPGDPFAATNPGLFDANFSGVFYGPQPPPPSPPPPPPFCPFTSRQQVGQYLYALDRDQRAVHVVNSNRFTVLATIHLPDPQSMAMSPNLRWLAVSNPAPSTVSLIDVDPLSPTFHEVLHLPVPPGPTGLAWQPDGEDLLIVHPQISALSIISARTGRLRNVLHRFLQQPIDVAVTARQSGIGFNTGTYFAYVLNGNGTVAVYESGPVAIGLDDIAAVVPAGFPRARAIQPDLTAFWSGCWVVHQDAQGLGQASRVELVQSPVGPLPNPAQALDAPLPPNRQRQFAVTARIGGTSPTTPVKDKMSGNVPVDLAFDDIRNNGALPDRLSPLSSPFPALHSGKGQVKVAGGSFVQANLPRFLFVALGDVGKVDVFEIATGRLIRSIGAPGVASLGHYWRQ